MQGGFRRKHERRLIVTCPEDSLYTTRINSAGALLAIRLLSEVIPQYIRTPSVSIRTVL